eukprot:TRINITY_DN3339_c0_g2_i1.p1 TRINITY_DN3339_c0_g2~~TRINITY_DN3339_c0_g2_i1.p1  ORF type:complete len:506 (-),score=152.40 TRINITY_DN3339_c0_g2_i1:46-1563(-)
MGDVEFSEYAQNEGVASIKNVRTSNLDWTLFGYQDKKIITFQSEGSGGLEELKTHLKEDQIQYGLLKVTDTIDNLPVTRFVFIVWIGKAVKIFVKSLSVTHRGKMKDFIGQAHVTIDAIILDDLQQDIIQQKVSDASGSSVRVLNENNERETKSTDIKQQGKIETGQLQFLDQENIKRAIQVVRNTTNAWVLIAYQGQTNNIELVAEGTQGVNELVEHLKPDMLGFALTRVEIQFDSQMVVRYATIDWVGASISTVRKAKTVTFKGTIFDFLGQAHVSIAASEPNDLSDEIVLQKVTQIAGTKSNIVETQNEPVVQKINTQPKPSNPPTKSVVGRGGSSLINNPKGGTNIVNTTNLGLAFDSDDCKEELKKVRSDESDYDFVLFGYVNNNPSSAKLRLVGSGNSGIEGLANSIEDDKNSTYYGLLRVNDVIVQTMKTVKFIFVTYMGEGIKTIQRAKLTTHKGSAQEMIGQVHCDLFAAKREELTPEFVNERINSGTFNTNNKIN